jgi:hypothetical protein
MKDIEDSLPFKIKGVATDNGSEFLNQNVHDFLAKLRDDPIGFVRRRAYKKSIVELPRIKWLFLPIFGKINLF